MGGRGSSSSDIPSIKMGGGGGGKPPELDQFAGSPKTNEEALGKKGRPMSEYNAVMKANPFYDETYGEYSLNCQRAVVAVEARLRGYNVIAQATFEGDDMPRNKEWMNSFKNAQSIFVGKTTVNATQKSIESEMQSFGDGSRAILRVKWKGKGNNGHVLNVIQKNGKTIYYDGQVGGKYDAKKLLSAVDTKRVELVRVDNLEFGSRVKDAVRQDPMRKK